MAGQKGVRQVDLDEGECKFDYLRIETCDSRPRLLGAIFGSTNSVLRHFAEIRSGEDSLPAKA